MRTESYGQSGNLSLVDKFGVYLSLRAVKKYIRTVDLSGCSILDLGCGYNAALLRAFGARARSATGVDVKVSEEVKALPNVKIYEGNIKEICPGLAGGNFDLITLINVLEHLDAPEVVLKECLRMLKNNGLLLVNVPTWRGKFFLELSAYRLNLSPRQEIEDHKMYYDKKDLWPVLIRAGFSPAKLKLDYHKFGLNLFAACRR